MTDLEGAALDLFVDIVGASAGERARRLQACAGVPDLRAQVEELLANHVLAETEDFLGAPPRWIDGIPHTLPDFGDFKQIVYLGHGGMGVVYRAFDTRLGCPVALKMPLPEHLTTPEIVALFHTEPKSMARLKHAHIVQVHKVDQHDGRPYFTMNLIEGTSLQRSLDRYRHDPRAAAELMVKVARAVQHAHSRGIFHRDLKPGNILLDKDGEPVVTDYGLAKVLAIGAPALETAAALTTASLVFQGIMGTIGYMPPEQAVPRSNAAAPEPADTPAEGLSDVYGLGGVLYALLTGQPPVQAPTPEEALNKVRNPEYRPTPPRRLNRRVDRDLEAVCLKCLEKNPEARYPTAEGVAKNLERWLNHLPIEPPPPRWRRCQLWMRRNPLGVGLLAIALGFLVLLGLRLNDLRQEPAQAQQALAEAEAKTVYLRLQQLRKAVETTVGQPDLVKFLKEDPDGLQQFIVKVGDSRLDLNGKSPFASWFVVSARDPNKGQIVARWPPAQPDQKFDRQMRDHYRGAMRRADLEGGSPVYISKVYKGPHVVGRRLGENPRFGLAAVIRENEHILGVLVASVSTGPILGFSPQDDHATTTALLAPIDPTFLEDIAGKPAEASDHLVLLHPAFQPGEPEEVWLPKEQMEAMHEGVSDTYHDPVAARHKHYEGRWLAGFAKVKDSPFVVVAQRRYTPAVPGGAIVAALMIALALLAAGVFVYRRARRT